MSVKQKEMAPSKPGTHHTSPLKSSYRLKPAQQIKHNILKKMAQRLHTVRPPSPTLLPKNDRQWTQPDCYLYSQSQNFTSPLKKFLSSQGKGDIKTNLDIMSKNILNFLLNRKL